MSAYASLLPLPPYSPELNPVEHLWEEIREKGLSNTAFQSLNELEDKLCEKIREISENTSLIKSMTNFPYLNVTL
jgi:transposase